MITVILINTVALIIGLSVMYILFLKEMKRLDREEMCNCTKKKRPPKR